jgi:hypothetical protein
MAKKFPDLTGDGEVTQADVLKGRGVFNEGGEVDNYIELFEQMQMSLEQAESEKEENMIRQRFEQSTEGFDQNIIMQAYKKMDAMREQMFEGGSLMVPPEREAYGKGGAILDFFEMFAKKSGVKKKKGMKDAEVAEEIIRVNEAKDPQFLDSLSDEEYETLVSKLSPKSRAAMGMGEESMTDAVEMARGMNPADVAKNLEMFDSVDDIFDYADTLDAKDARMFMNNLSDEDLEIFGSDLPDVGASLGPREVKAEGGETAIAIMMPAEIPEDTYDNISPEEAEQQAEDMLPDDEMEEEYLDFVTQEILEKDEQEYLFKVLDDDPRLEEILDKVILSATEFAGSGEVEGPGTGISDSIPARLSDGEFVFTRKATDQLGADNLQQIMDDAERAYDGGLMAMAEGGMAEDPQGQIMDTTSPYAVQKETADDVERQMLYASRMPSLMNR